MAGGFRPPITRLQRVTRTVLRSPAESACSAAVPVLDGAVRAFRNPSRQPREPSRSTWQRALMVSPGLMYSRVDADTFETAAAGGFERPDLRLAFLVLDSMYTQECGTTRCTSLTTPAMSVNVST